MAPEEWFLLHDGRQMGPLTRDQLAASLLRRSRGVLVWHQGMEGWARPDLVPELLRRVAAPPPSTPGAYEAAFRAAALSYGAIVAEEVDEHEGNAADAAAKGLSFEATRDGVAARVTCEPGETRARLTISVKGSVHPRLTASLEGELEQLGKRLRLSREVQTGDAAFDGTVYLDSPLPDAAVREIASRPEFRRGVRTLLDQRFAAVHLDEDGLSVERSVERAAELERPQLDATLAAVALVETSMRGLDPAWSRHRASSWPSWLMGASVLAGLAGVPACYLARLAFTPVHDVHVLLAVGAGVAVWAVALGLLALMLRGRSDAMFHLAVSGSLLLVALGSWTGAGLIGFNALFDRKPPIEREMVVRSKSTEKTRVRIARHLRHSHRREYLTVAAGPVVRKIRVTEETYDSVENGSTITVTSRAGALGWEWDQKER